MTDPLEELAQGSLTVIRPPDSVGEWPVEGLEPYDADEVSPEDEFPQYGQWLKLAEDADVGSAEYLQITQDLAAAIVADVGDYRGPAVVVIEEVQRGDGDSDPYLYEASVETVDDPVETAASSEA